MTTHRSILTAAALLAFTILPAGAITLPVAEDTSSSILNGRLTAATGAAATLSASTTQAALVRFDLSTLPANVGAGNITSATLRLYVLAVRTGTTSVAAFPVTADWHEKVVSNVPAADTNGGVLLSNAPVSKTFISADVTAAVQSALNGGPNFGFLITTSAGRVVLGAKEGPASGYPAELDIEVNPTSGPVGGTTASFTGSVSGNTGSFNSATLGNPNATTSLALGTNSITANLAPGGNSLTTSSLTIGTARGDLTLNAGTNGSVGGHIQLNGNAGISGNSLTLGDYNLASDSFLTVETKGGNFFSSGVKLRHFSDDYGVTLQSNEATGHFQILTHFQDPTGVSVFEISRNSQGTVSVPNFLTVGQIANDGVFRKGRIEVLGSVSRGSSAGPVGYFAQNGTAVNIPDGGGENSIYASNQIDAGQFVAFSDERIKNIQGRSAAAADLSTLRRLEITDYFYKDTVARGSRPQKKVIAQQVEQVFPQAVSQSTDVVPDIYKKAEIKDGWVQIDTDLKVGERVRLIGEKEEDGIREVLEVRDGAFRTAFRPAGDQVFVFGREVKDFRAVDYEAIAMLNVSATQELARELEVKDAEIAALKAANLALAEKMAAFDQQFTALKAALDDRPARTVRASFVK